MFTIESTKLRRTLGYNDRIEFLLDNTVSVFFEVPNNHTIDRFNDNLLFQIDTADTLLGFGDDFKNTYYYPVLSDSVFLNNTPKTIGFVKAD